MVCSPHAVLLFDFLTGEAAVRGSRTGELGTAMGCLGMRGSGNFSEGSGLLRAPMRGDVWADRLSSRSAQHQPKRLSHPLWLCSAPNPDLYVIVLTSVSLYCHHSGDLKHMDVSCLLPGVNKKCMKSTVHLDCCNNSCMHRTSTSAAGIVVFAA